MQILIRNIDRTLSRNDILEIFQKYGKVNSFDLVMDNKTGSSKGFGFAEMPNMDEAMKAISELNGKKLAGTVVRVKRAANSSLKKRN